MSGIVTMLVSILVFAVMVTVHEFGHFATAKLFKINVAEFAIGMGPAIFKKKRKETTYAIRAIPLGGYCMFEDDLDAETESPNAFSRAAWYKRLCVALAGAFLNLVLGFLVFVILQTAQPTVFQPVISGFVPQTQMAQSAFETGDKIVQLNNTKIHIKDDIDFFMQRNGDAPVLVVAKRDGKSITDTITPSKAEHRFVYGETAIEYTLLIDGVAASTQTIPVPEDAEYQEYIGQTASSSSYLLGFEGTVQKRSIGTVLHNAFYTTIYNVKIVYISLIELLRGQVPANQVSGPIGIVNVIDQATKIGWETVLALVGLLTVNLGIMNLLPIPALDGCKAIALLIEGITRKKLPQKVEGYINFAGFALLILLTIWATFNDIQNIFIK